MAETAETAEERDDGPQKKSREDYRKQKELDEARKSGLEPAEQDEFGVDINPHIPQYIKDSPWYLQMDGPTLTHQRTQPETVKTFDSIDRVYNKGVTNRVATKFRKGACTNCGAVTHKKIDCLEKPRKIGAKWSGRDFAPDEYIPESKKLDFEGKRDRWIGYDTTTHEELIEEFDKVEKVKQQIKAESLNKNVRQETVSKSGSESEEDNEDEYKYTEQANMPGTKFDNKKRQTVRNLRIREDTAKYLLNLDTNSAHYDPKSRSMRDNPLQDLDHKKPSELSFTGENFVRSTGQVKEIAQLQLFSWEAGERGSTVHLQAEPTKAALLHKEYVKRKDEFKNEVSNSIIDKYGGGEHLKAPPRELLLASTEEYVEYSRTGKVIKGQEKVISKSKYQEDVLVNGHTRVYGSYFSGGAWGYKCCLALQKQAYCTGAASRAGADAPAVEEVKPTNLLDRSRPLTEIHQEKMVEERKKRKQKIKEDRENPQAREERLKKILDQLATKEAEEKAEGLDERKRSYNSMVEDKGPTEEEMEAYKLRKHMSQDPMANFKT